MHSRPHFLRRLAILILAALLLLAARPAASQEAKPLRVCATIPDLGDIAREIGGPEVAVTVLTKGPQDPHFVEARPSFIVELNRADLFLQAGLDLEVGWVPALLRSARNPGVQPGGRGFLDVSSAVQRLEVPAGRIDRSMGDVHPQGNPHYLLDPLNGIKVAGLIRDRLVALRPEKASAFRERHDAFARRVTAALLGEKLLAEYDEREAPKLLLLLEKKGLRELAAFLEEQGQKRLLGGWLGAMLPYAGTRVVADHNLWPYFAERFGLEIVDFLEPKPGISPTTRHLGEVIARMRSEGIELILDAPYFNPRHARFVAEKTGARIADMAHQVGARPGTESYISMVDYNVRQILETSGGQR
jgi:ABC-type Zn uptake system ZnuABC Zn-binding protein ZnuA